MDTAIRDCTRRSTEDLARREAELREARRKLDNIADAIADGIRTPTTLAGLQEAEQQVAACEAAVREAKQQRTAPVVVVKTAINRYLADLRATLATDVDEARRLLARGFDRIVLRRDEDGRLWAHVEGNLAGLFNLEGADGLLEMVPEEGLEPPRA